MYVFPDESETTKTVTVASVTVESSKSFFSSLQVGDSSPTLKYILASVFKAMLSKESVVNKVTYGASELRGER